MLEKEEFIKYNRQIILDEVGTEGQLLIKKAKIVVVGAGGLGCCILNYLVSSGIGHIKIIDFDTVDVSNLPRQILYGTEDVGKKKVLIAKEKLHSLNPSCLIETEELKLDSTNALKLLEGFDIIIDACDDLETRYVINDVCSILKTPVVYGAIEKFEGQVGIFNYQGSKKYEDLFPSRKDLKRLVTCDTNGVLGVIPGLIGLFQVNEVLKMILKMPSHQLLTNRLLIYNFLNHQQSLLKY